MAALSLTSRLLAAPLERPLGLEFVAQTPALRALLDRAFDLVRIRTGLLWHEAGDADTLTVAYGDEAWLRDVLAGAAGATLVIRAAAVGVDTLLSEPALRLAPAARSGMATRLDDDLPALLEALTHPRSDRLLTALRADDCQPTLDLSIPWTDVAVDHLSGALLSAAPAGTQLARIAPLPGRFGIALSHDVDYVTTSFRYRWTRLYYLAAAARTSPAALPRLLGHYSRAAAAPRVWRHLTSLAVEAEFGIESDWFIFARDAGNERGLHARAFNPRYRLEEEDVRTLLTAITEREHVIGLHASPEAGEDAAQLERERRALERAGGAPVTAVRHHMGRLRWPSAAAAGMRLGFDYDSSFIVNDAQGYRLGTGGVVPLAVDGGDVLELSPTWMDSVAYNYEGKSAAAIAQELECLVERLRENGGIAGVVWHDIPMGRDGAEVGVYRRFLRAAVERGGVVAPCRLFVARARALLASRLVRTGGGVAAEVPPDLQGERVEAVGEAAVLAPAASPPHG